MASLRHFQILQAKNTEVETAVEDLLARVGSFELDPSVTPVSEAEMDKLRLHYNAMMYQVRPSVALGSLCMCFVMTSSCIPCIHCVA